MVKTTLSDLHVMLARVEERQINIVNGFEQNKIWQEKHEEKDEESFAKLYKYARSLAVVSFAIGCVSTLIFK